MAISGEDKRARLAELLKQRAQAPKVSPLSSAQERLWFVEQWNEGLAGGSMAVRVRIEGELDHGALARALRGVVQRHEALRTTFTVQDDRVMQVVAPSASPRLAVVDLEASGGDARAREALAEARIVEEARAPFALTGEPLLRASLYRVGPRAHLLLVNVHHLLADAWSMGILVRELGALYRADVEKRPAGLPPLPLQYVEYAAWERTRLENEALEAQLAYFRSRLDPRALLTLPSDRPREATNGARGARHTVTLSLAVASSVHGLARAHGATLFTTLLTAFQVLLQRYTGQDDLVVGTPVAGRNRPEIEGLFGPFLNMVALRADLGGGPRFGDLLRRVHASAMEALANQEIPFEKVVEALQPERATSHAPIVQVTFALQNAPLPALDVPDLRFEAEPVDTVTTRFDLSLVATEVPAGLRLTFEYATALFDAETIARMATHFEVLLRGAAARPGAAIDALPLLDDAERDALLGAADGAARDLPRDRTVLAMFAERVAEAKDAPAATFEGETLAYGALDAAADHLARHLRSMGVARGERVAILLERSLDVPVALLAVLKAGAAYVPLDPAYPREHLALVLEDAAPRVVLTHRGLDVDAASSTPRVAIDRALPPPPAQGVFDGRDTSDVRIDDGDGEPRVDGRAPLDPPRGDDVAYVIYTSGSTGAPKGVVVPHAALANVLASMAERPGLDARDVLVAVTSLAFDVAAVEIFLPLTRGARVVIAPRDATGDPAALAELLAKSSATVLQATPTTYRALVDAGWDGGAITRALCGGEALSASLARELLARPFALWNVYGPTETTVWSTCGRVERDDAIRLGAAVANTQTWVLDPRGHLAPFGVPGELYIGGRGVAAGYWRRPDLTAACFVPSPFGEGRLYRTGDRVRRLRDGSLELLGRLDRQVKVRGHRVELLTPNGKIDRAAPPAPDASPDTEDAFVAPRSPLEEAVAEVWTEVLRAPRVGVYDDFFAIGGTSIDATRVVARLRTRLGVELSVRAVFEAKTVAGLSAKIDAAAHAAGPARAAAQDASIPLSIEQQRSWFLAAMDPEDASFHVASAWQIDGCVDADTLARTLVEIARRHEPLRTTFEAADGAVRPAVAADAVWPLAIEDLGAPGGAGAPRDASSVGAAAREDGSRDEALRRAHDEAARPFPLDVAPLARARLLRLSDDAHVLVLVMHPLVADAGSMAIVAREIAAIYPAFAAGLPSPLPELELRYSDFARWQRRRRWLAGDALGAQLAYWRERLAGLAPTALPADRPRLAGRSRAQAAAPIAIDPALAGGIARLAESAGVTASTVILAAFQALLGRTAGQTDVAVGTPVSGRDRGDVAGLVGRFASALILRVDLSGDPTFREVLSRARDAVTGARAHADVPFAKLVDELEHDRDRTRAPLVQTMFVLHDLEEAEPAAGGVALRELPLTPFGAHLDATLTLRATIDGFSGALQYDADVFDARTMERTAARLTLLLAAAVADPDRRVSEIPLVSDAERALLDAWNDAAAVPRRDACVHELVLAHAARTPSAIAVVFGDEHVTYAELDLRARALAAHLRALGVGPDVPVGVALPRSVDLVVALLGVLAAGGAYVPLDPAYPAERLAFIARDTELDVVVTRSDVPPLFGAGPSDARGGDARRGRERDGAPSPAPPAPRYVRVDADAEAIAAAARAGTAPRARSSPESAAYVMYTSGSTGVPKGVVVPHGAVVHLACAAGPLELTTGDAVLQLAPVAFDASTFEIWSALARGARVVVAPPEPLSLQEIGQTLVAHGVTVLWLTAALFHRMVDERIDDLRGLRALVAGGDVLSPSHVARALDALPGCRVVNGYGPTENTTFTCAADLRAWGRVGAAPIGRPIDGTRVYVLDEHLEPAPIGVRGELYAAGAGLARGYASRPGETAARFLPDPFSGEPGARMYRTGDLARFTGAGDLEYLGRTDDQVKIRGYRVELGEIEAVLRGLAGVGDAAVIVRDDAPGDKRIVAYVVAAPPEDVRGGTQDDRIDTAELRARLLGVLPEYLVPSAFVRLDALPLTANGKVDRRLLPAPPTTRGDDDSFVPPRSALEAIIAAAWAEVLRIDRVGVHDDFFALGGHSLTATQAIARARSYVGADVPLRAFFDGPSVAVIAARMALDPSLAALAAGSPALGRAIVAEQAASGAAPGARAGDRAPLDAIPTGAKPVLSYAQRRLWLLEQLQPGGAEYTITAAHRITGRLDAEVLRRVFGEIVRRHEVLRTTFEARDGDAVPVVRPEAPWTLSLVDRASLARDEQEREVARHVNEERERPFDLARGPLLRTTLLRLGPERHVLVTAMHHIVADGWSMGVLDAEIASLYPAMARGARAPLGDLAIQYADYAAWQRGWLEGDVLDAQLAYWKAQLAGVAPLAIATDRPRPPVARHRGAQVAIAVARETADALKRLSREHGVTLFMTLLAAFQTLLHRYGARDDVAVGTPIANRQRREIEPLIGFFVNTLVLRGDLSRDPPFVDLLARTRETTLAAYANQDAPFEKVVDVLGVERSLSRNPVFQAVFALHNAPAGALAIPGLQLEPLATGSSTSKFDLALALFETASGLDGHIEYDTDLFDEATIERMASHLYVLLEGVLADPARRLSALPLLTPRERDQIVVAWNETRADYPRDACVHALFAAQAAATPDAIAVTFGDERISYRELDRRADRVASHLRGLGVTDEAMVGLSLPRSVDLIVAILGILKAGGAYVPLDPALPPQRLAFMIGDTRLAAIVTHEAIAPKLPAGGAAVVCLDAAAVRAAVDLAPDAAPPRTPSPRARAARGAAGPDAARLAYVMYTSGSTGAPKGVGVTHGGIVRLARASYVDVGPADVLLHYAPIAFDASTLEIWTALLRGAELVVAPPGPLSLEELGRTIASRRVSTAFLTTALFHAMVDDRLCDLGGLRYLLSGGDVLSPSHVERVIGALPGCRFVACYGPTESTTLTTVLAMSGSSRTRPVPIGRPLDGTRVYVLDASLEPAPIGVPGELYTSGDGLARGYVNRPEQTAERFVPDPFAREPGGRLYRTGDVARYLPSGEIEFVGRADHQIKLRGFRIELGEIEAALAAIASVREAFAVVREDAPGDKRIVAYLVGAAPDAAKPARAPSAAELREELAKRLPEYMIPSAFVWLDALPLTANGKVDRRALPAPEADAGGASFVAPRTDAERVMAETWAEVLHVDRIGVHDDFFALGGHSLSATQVVVRVRARTGVELPVRAIFEAKTVASLSARVEAIRAETASAPPTAVPEAIASVPRGALATARDERPGAVREAPLSHSQLRFWFLEQWSPGKATANVPVGVRLTGDLHRDALDRALRGLVERHAALRTTFAMRGEHPVQIVAPSHEVRLPLVDLTSHPEGERERAAFARLEEDARELFDLANEPSFRTTLYRLGPREHVLSIRLHHIVSDGWSAGIIARELGAMYYAAVLGLPSPLPPLPMQYADYAVWESTWHKTAAYERQVAYWTSSLDPNASLALPTDRPRPEAPSSRGAVRRRSIGPSLVLDLKALSRAEHTTLFVTLMAAFQALLHRYTGQPDVVVGTAIAGRTRAEFEGVVGPFINMLAIRGELGDDPPFDELVRRMHGRALAAYAHQDVPFERLVDALHPERSRSHAPLFQVMLILQNTPRLVLDAHGLRLEILRVHTGTAKLDLTFNAIERDGGLDLTIEYAADLFDPETIERMALHFEALLEAAVRAPGRRITDLSFLPDAERDLVVSTWNDTRAIDDGGAEHRFVIGAFEANARRAPGAIALVLGAATCTYGELERRSRAVARRLRALGVGAESRVGLCAERSIDLIVGLLGVLRAGGAYVPIEPALPAERRRFLLADAGAFVVLATRAAADAFARDAAASKAHEGAPVSIVALDAIEVDLGGDEDDDLGPAPPPEAAAYVLYTSGSTGTPKGVVVPHRALDDHCAWMQWVVSRGGADPERAREERVLFQSAFTFDASVWEILGPLVAGGRVVILPAEAQGDPAAMARTIAEQGVTTITVVPSLLAALVDEPAMGAASATPAPSLRRAISGGEALAGDLVRRFFDRLPGAELLNTYGPTEATIDTSYLVCTEADAARAMVPIGRPNARARLYVLDHAKRPAPIGVPGELHVGGPGVARGYLERPGLTAAAFIPDPFSREPGARLYATGDRARWLKDGTVEFLGRLDHQVKLRGIRIELGEIEAKLAEHPRVRDAVVVVREDTPGRQRLTAYLVARAGASERAAEDDAAIAARRGAAQGDAALPDAGDLRAHLQTKLPEYMVPQAFVWLDAMPMTANGKVDRRALPAPGAAAEGAERSYIAPRTPLEEIVCDAWAGVLQVDVGEVSVHDNFFDLGGHSLLATQVMSRVRARVGVEVPLRALFDAPTVAGLCEKIEAIQRLDGAAIPALGRASLAASKEAPPSFAQQRLWFLHALDPDDVSYHIAGALRLDGPLDVVALERSLAEIARRHAALRTTFTEIDGEPLQVIHEQASWPLPRVDLRGVDGDAQDAAIRRAAHDETARRFDLAAAPLARARLLRLADDAHVLVVVMHHIVSDGWSVGVFVRELGALYPAFAAGEPSPLPELPLQYPDFATWQRAWLSGPVLDRQLDYWKAKLHGVAPLALLTDHPRPKVRAGRGALLEVTIGQRTADALEGLGRREGVTLFMTLLAAFQALLARYTGQRDIAVGSPIANRTRDELEGLIGFFANTLVLRTSLDGAPSFRELLARVRETTLGAYAHQDVPFEKLVEVLAPARDRSRSPLFQVMFSLQNAPVGTFTLKDLSLTPLSIERTTAKFELSLGLRETPDGLRGDIEYDRDLFERSTIERLARHFASLLDAAVAAPDAPVRALGFLDDDERRTLLVDWNDTRTDYPRGLCVHELFDDVARRSPHAVAALFDDRSLTYDDLARRANRLANHLRSLGVRADHCVGVSLERGFDLLVALLAILKAGAAYVPLDTSLPASRVAFMLDGSRVHIVVTDLDHAPRFDLVAQHLPHHSSPSLVRVDADADAIARASDLAPPASTWPHGLAYVLYTSGSTGTPKGVGVEHRAVVRLARATRYLQLTHEDVVLQFAPVAFDLSTFELWTTLLHGARVAIAPPGHVSFEELGHTIVRLGVTTAWLTAALFHRMVDEQLDSLRGLERLLAGGDVLSPAHVLRVLDELPHCRLINGYGPTENTTFTTSADLRRWDREGSVTIGTPIDDTSVYILDDLLQPVPVGVVGHLFTGGDGLARGYMSRPDLTAERFIPDPFAAHAGNTGARMYRTGDLARYRLDGHIEFFGREDHQVKLRGFRVELGEIEAALAQHPTVLEAAVVVRADAAGEKRVLAYLVAAEGASVAANDLREHLRASLPDYMVPTAFVVLDAMPMTPNGKVDRRALPEPGDARAAEEPFVAPRTKVEERLVAIWREVLGVVRVSITQSFFDLGGHSLLATRLMSRVRAAFGVELPLRTLFDHPTVAGFAAELAVRCVALPKLDPLVRSAPSFDAEGRSTGPVSVAQERWLVNERSDPHRPPSIRNMPMCVRIQGPLDPALLQRTLDVVVERHEIFRTYFAEEDGQLRSVVGPPARLVLERVDLSGLAPEAAEIELRRRVREDAARPFTLMELPMFRAWLYVVGDEDAVVLLSTHHIAWDAYSDAIMLREIGAAYHALTRGEEPRLPPLPIQHSDFARWQDAQLRGPYGEALEAYWRTQLRGTVPLLDFPTDRARPEVRTYQGCAAALSLGGELSAAIRALGRRTGSTLYMTLVAAYQTLLAIETGEHDVAVFTNVAGRDYAEVEDLLGCFTNIVLVRTKLGEDPTFEEILGRTRDAVLGAFTHQAFPYQRVNAITTPSPDYRRAINYPGFNLQNVESPPVAMDGLTFTQPKGILDGVVVANMFFFAVEEGGVIRMFAQANADLYDASTVARLLGEYRRLLELACADPARRLEALAAAVRPAP